MKPLYKEIAAAMGWTELRVKHWQGRNRAPVWSVECFRIFVQAFHRCGLGAIKRKAVRGKYLTENRETVAKGASVRWKNRDREQEKKKRLAAYKRNPTRFLKTTERYAGKARKTEKWKTRVRGWMKRREARDPNFKIRRRLSTRIYIAVKLQRADKTGSARDLLGCSPQELRVYLEGKFKPGMTWKNYGQWHVDHIKPCAKFDLTDPDQQRACFHFTNLQPLWARENLIKSAKYGETS